MSRVNGRGSRLDWLRGIGLALPVVWLAFATTAAQGRTPPAGPPTFADLVAQVAPAVVNITTRKLGSARAESPPAPQVPPGSPFDEFFREFFEREPQREPPPPRRSISLGSGFIIDPEGYVVTNNHVIADADEISVVLHDEKEVPAKVVGRDPKTDLALLKIEGDKPFPYVEWADSDQVRVGDWMLAIGNPFGLGFSVTAGIVSARGRDIRSGPYDDYFQVDAAINRGNSGGPSFTLEGKVFGVNTAIFSPSGGNIGIGFAIPSNLARPVIDSLKRTGRVARGWLGVRIQTVTEEIAESIGLKEPVGALVASVTPGGPAAASAIEQGDVILEFDGKKIDKMRTLPRIVAETPVGREVEVTIWRKGEKKTVRVKLGELPDEDQLSELGKPREPPRPGPATGSRVPELGLVVSPITPELKSRFSLPDQAKGVVVVEVDPDGPMAQEGVRPGDLIVEAMQDEIKTPGDLLAKIEASKRAGRKAALLLVERQGEKRFVAPRYKE
ncbi:MAG: DegQ family serine endoprotease [Geminicoccaceae bacterium]|nr:DegQ family serine endoprotease [Geminicoccaceae bacterium]MCS7267658.1 DegQ family serine endoprotease [Geminicoccaceae bacterium]MCX7630066.1 DegQ family serine endoprotease [Geminicoccaceae bacterium]MDW8123501.1 DegQ family serine endoprotease [Geminicoccaceae bacterium]MDW8342173.1 DegQ family serine endoprotease [Geminicoccaceae bacterium]